MELFPIHKIDQKYLMARFGDVAGKTPLGHTAMYKVGLMNVSDAIVYVKNPSDHSVGYFDMHYGWVWS